MGILSFLDAPKMEARIAQLERDNQALMTYRDGYNRLKSKYDLLDGTIKSLLEEASAMKEKIHRQQDALKLLVNERDNALSAYKTLSDEYKQLSNDYDGLQSRYDDLKARNEEILEQDAILRNENQELHERCLGIIDNKMIETNNGNGNGNYKDLTANQKKIVEYLKANPDKVMQDICAGTGLAIHGMDSSLRPLIKKQIVIENKGRFTVV